MACLADECTVGVMWVAVVARLVVVALVVAKMGVVLAVATVVAASVAAVAADHSSRSGADSCSLARANRFGVLKVRGIAKACWPNPHASPWCWAPARKPS